MSMNTPAATKRWTTSAQQHYNPALLINGQRSPRARMAGLASMGAVAGIIVGGVLPASATAPTPASSSFDPAANGFSFDNYSTSPGQSDSLPLETLTAADAFGMYGARACDANPTAANCVANATVAAWLKGLNASGTGGHCFGMSILGQLLFNGSQKPPQISTSYTAGQSAFSFVTPPATSDPSGNVAALTKATELRHSVLYWWATQFGSNLNGDWVSPTQAVTMLSSAFGSAPNVTPYVLSFNAHTISPIGVAAGPGPGLYLIKVYDNNFPGQTLNINVDPNADTFSYDGDGSDPTHKWSGTGNGGSLELSNLAEIQTPKCMPGNCTASSQNADSDLIVRRQSDHADNESDRHGQ